MNAVVPISNPLTNSIPTPLTGLQTLEDQITELAAHISAATWRLLNLIREYDARSGWNGGGTKSCAHWLNWKCGINLGAAREKVRVAHALGNLPQISEAFRDGRLSYSKVRAMTRVATPENEDYLLMIATHGTASHIESVVRNYRRLGRLEAKEQLAERMLTYSIEADGSYAIRGRLTPEQGERLIQALDKTSEDIPQDDERSPAMRRADGLETLAESLLSNESSKSTGGDRYTVHVHTKVEDLAEAGDVSAETPRRQSCDCGVVHWLENGRGQALSIGRRSRNITPAIRRALQHRDGGCTFPGCTAHRHVDAHYVKHWADGGETKLDNLVLLCRHHHRLVHEGGFGVTLNSAGKARFTDPKGNTLPAGQETRFCGNAFALREVHQDSELEIGPRSLLPRWNGERMDLGMAIDGLLRRGSSSLTGDTGVH